MSPREKGIALAESRRPLTREQVETAARILASLDVEEVAA